MNISSALNKTTVALYEPFFLTISIDFPSTFDNELKLDVLGNISSDGLPRMKVCTVKVYSSGENLPCENCLQRDKIISYVDNSSAVAYDKLTWSINNIKNSNLRSSFENATANRLVYI